MSSSSHRRRRSTSKTSSRSSSTTSTTASNSSASSTVVQQLQLLRDFVGTTEWTEAQLTDCLRLCGYNVNRAAERLMTGQYSSSNVTSTNSATSRTKPTYFDLVASMSPQSNKTKASSSSKSVPRSKHCATTTTTIDLASSPPRGTPAITPHSDTKSDDSTSSLTSKESSPISTSSTTINLPTEEEWLLCHRWISNATCTIRVGKTAYRECLTTTVAKSGAPCVRFQGKHVQGRLPDALAQVLSPLLLPPTMSTANTSKRASSQQQPPKPPLIRINVQALMEDSHIVLGAQIPLSIQVFVLQPRALLALFDTDHSQHAARPWWNTQSTSTRTTLTNSNHNYNNNNRIQQDAAFGLLQWAEYGDVLEFPTPTKNHNKDDTLNETKPNDSEDGLAELDEDEFEASEAVSPEGAKLDQSLTTTDWAMSLPVLPDPIGFASGVTMRPYQKQALYWMVHREAGVSRDELEQELELLAELATEGRAVGESYRFLGKENKGAEIVCDCGPVLVSNQAKIKTRTLDGEMNPVGHPLWKQRYLASPDLKETVCFYVNELLGIATHRPPKPPSPCSGGVLADSMGLGKTIMLLALILKSKEDRKKKVKDPSVPIISERSTKKPTATLVVAKLSLLPQWEEEIKSKTNLSYLVYYGPQCTRTMRPEDFNKVDIVITTYGTIQGENNRERPALLGNHWLRVVLDEAHCIKNQNTLASKVCCRLTTEHRWCVSGTIVQNSVDDVFGIMKFLKHEPWCLPAFWKSAVSKPLSAASDDPDDASRQKKLDVILDRVRRLLSPLMLRRTKDSMSIDGKPILTLPPVETKVIKVDFSETEREFYNAVLAKSLQVFEGYVESGAMAKSYFQIFSLLQRLRQVCDHIALTVRSRIGDEDDKASTSMGEEDASKENEESQPKEDALGKRFLQDLLQKFCTARSSPRKNDKPKNSEASPSPSKKLKDNSYLSNVAHAVADAVQSQREYVQEECPICLEQPKVAEALLTPCGHIFCQGCLVPFLQGGTPGERPDPSRKLSHCPDGTCPCCNKAIPSKRIIALAKSDHEDGVMTTKFLSDMGMTRQQVQEYELSQERRQRLLDPHAAARQTLDAAVAGSCSSKMSAILQELDNVWTVDPGANVLIFSHYLGFLDLLQRQFTKSDIPNFRLDGSLTLAQRMTVLDDFRSSAQQPKLPQGSSCSTSNKGTILLLSMAAGGEGLNLQSCASVCFVCEPWWNAAKEDQCTNRIHRIGQLAPVVRVRKFVIANSVEERILELQRSKTYMAEEIYKKESDETTGTGGTSTRLSLEDFRTMFRL